MSRNTERPFEPLTVADVFCGAGGLSAGFRSARRPDGRRAFRVVFGLDHDPDAIETFRSNLIAGKKTERAHRAPCRSVVGLTGADILEAAGVDAVDVLVGGPNCQAVSTAGRRNLADARNTMFEEYARLVDELQPRWFLMENVPGLTHAHALPLLNEIFERLGALRGYTVGGDVMLAADFGVAQYRYRLFLLGSRTTQTIGFPTPSHFAGKNPRYRTVADVIGRGRNDRAQLHVPEDHLDVNVRRIRRVPPGGDWRDIPIDLLPARSFWVRSSDQKGAYGRLTWSEPAFTITSLAHNVTAGPFTHPDEDRSISPDEAAALQGFTPTYKFFGSGPSRYRQIGNAVPPPLARALAETIIAMEAGRMEGLRSPRLSSAVVKDALLGRRKLPVMTPRVSIRSAAKPTRDRRASRSRSRRPRASVEPIVQPAAVSVLRVEAGLPMNTWTAKRAKAIVGVLDGRSPEALATELRISADAVIRWHKEFVARGVEGWRAYHTPVSILATGEQKRRIKRAVERARRQRLVASTAGAPEQRGVNLFRRRLVERFKGETVNTLMSKLAKAGHPVGTIYVGDLLAVASVLIEPSAISAERHVALGAANAGLTSRHRSRA